MMNPRRAISKAAGNMPMKFIASSYTKKTTISIACLQPTSTEVIQLKEAILRDAASTSGNNSRLFTNRPLVIQKCED